jgi:hypothetical protein
MLHLISCVAGVSRFGRDVLLSLSLAKLEQVNARLKRPSLGRGHRFETMAGAIAADEGAGSEQCLVAGRVAHPHVVPRAEGRRVAGAGTTGPPASCCAKRQRCSWDAGCAGPTPRRSRWPHRVADDRSDGQNLSNRWGSPQSYVAALRLV